MSEEKARAAGGSPPSKPEGIRQMLKRRWRLLVIALAAVIGISILIGLAVLVKLKPKKEAPN